MNRFWILLYFISIFYIISSCKKNDNNLTVGDNLVNVNSDIVINDTSTLKTYTVKSDSIITSGTAKLLVGKYQDGNFGSITATSYFQVGVSSALTLETNAVFDSISLVLHYSNYYYGDTTRPYAIEAHQLMDKLDYNQNDNGYRYNTSKAIRSDPTPIGKTTFYPRPSSNTVIYVSLSKDMGKNLFDTIMERQTETDGYDQTKFLNYFRGIALVPKAGAISSIIRFGATDSSLYMRLYYHVGETSKYLNFSIFNGYLQFNKIDDDLSFNKSPLDTLRRLKDRLSSLKSGNATYCQGGTGFLTRIEFPYLKNLQFTTEHIKILKAQLILCPVKSTYKTVGLPPKLFLYEANDLNQIGYNLTDTLSQHLTVDNIYNETTAYTLDITSYISSIIQDRTDNIPAVIVTLPNVDFKTTLERVILSNGLGQANSTRLKIWYWRY